MAERDTRTVEPSRLAAAAGELVAGGMALAMVVATDEQDRDGGLAARYLFEPAGGAEGGPLPDRFVTLEVPVDPARPEVPSLSSRADGAVAGWAVPPGLPCPPAHGSPR